MFGTRWSAVAVLGFALAACSHSRPATRSASAGAPVTAQQGAGEQDGMEARCPGPMAMPGTKVAAEDAPSGVAVTFTTAGDVDELRRRVHGMADRHNAHRGAEGEPGDAGAQANGGAMGGMQGGMGGMHGGGMHGGTAMPESTASVEDVDGGARVFITPKDPSDLVDLQQTVRMHVEHMQMAGCGTKSGTGMNEEQGADEPKLGDRS